MREPSFLVLAALASGPRHGYAIMVAIQEEAGEGRGLKPGTLYAALDRLSGEGLIHVVREEVVDGRPRRYYDLTDDGVAALEAEVARLQHRSAFALRGLGTRGLGLRGATA